MSPPARDPVLLQLIYLKPQHTTVSRRFTSGNEARIRFRWPSVCIASIYKKKQSMRTSYL